MLAVQLQTLWWELTDRFRDDDGATMPEYALMVALIAIAVIAGARALGVAVDDRLDGAGTAINTA